MKMQKKKAHKYLRCAVCGGKIQVGRGENVMDDENKKLVPVHRECSFTPAKLAAAWGYSWKSFEWRKHGVPHDC